MRMFLIGILYIINSEKLRKGVLLDLSPWQEPITYASVDGQQTQIAAV